MNMVTAKNAIVIININNIIIHDTHHMLSLASVTDPVQLCNAETMQSLQY